MNDIHNPATFYVVHPYGMSLIFGKHDNPKFNQKLREYALNKKALRNAHEWMQAYPERWDVTLKELFADCSIKSSENEPNKTKEIIELNTRVNFNLIPKNTTN